MVSVETLNSTYLTWYRFQIMWSILSRSCSWITFTLLKLAHNRYNYYRVTSTYRFVNRDISDFFSISKPVTDVMIISHLSLKMLHNVAKLLNWRLELKKYIQIMIDSPWAINLTIMITFIRDKFYFHMI